MIQHHILNPNEFHGMNERPLKTFLQMSFNYLNNSQKKQTVDPCDFEGINYFQVVSIPGHPTDGASDMRGRMDVFVKYSFLVFLLVWILPIYVFAGDNARLKLKDGSTISGEVLSMQNGQYEIFTNSLGKLKVNASMVLSIEYGVPEMIPSQGQSPNNLLDKNKLQSLQQEMFSDGQIMNLMLSLQNDPVVMKILSDPELMKAITSGNINMLQNNSRIAELMKIPAVQEITKQIQTQ